MAVAALEPGPSGEVKTMWDPIVDGTWIERDRDLVIGAALAETLDVDIGDKLVFMHQGKVLSEGSIEHVKQDPKVIEVYLGH